MKASSSLTAPQIELKLTGSTVPDWNYCYIAELGQRYYYIQRTFFELGIWTFQLTVDVLGTYKADIRASRQFVIRSTSTYRDELIDTMYPSVPGYTAHNKYAGAVVNGVLTPGAVKGTRNNSSTVTILNYFDRSLSSGHVVLGVKGNNTSGVTYYAMNTTAFNNLVTSSFSIHPSMSDDSTDAFANAVYDPLQYVTSARWYPYAMPSDSFTSVSSIMLGNKSASLGTDQSAKVLNEAFSITWSCMIDIPKHPFTNDYGYLNLSPYTELNLYMQPFGFIPLDTVRCYDKPAINIEWKVDYRTGVCAVSIGTASYVSGVLTANNDPFFINTYEYGVELPITALSVDWKTGAIISGLSFLDTISKNVFGSSLTVGDVKNAASNILAVDDGGGGGGGHSFGGYEPDKASKAMSSDNISLLGLSQDALASAMGQVQSVGGIGSFLPYVNGDPELYAYFYYQMGQNADKYGRPYYGSLYLDTLTGYALCGNAAVEYSIKHPLPPESTAVTDLLNSGIYLE